MPSMSYEFGVRVLFSVEQPQTTSMRIRIPRDVATDLPRHATRHDQAVIAAGCGADVYAPTADEA
jgi:hypothetical protein